MKTILKIVWFLVILLLVGLIETSAQFSDKLNLQKYWMARQRLKEHYVVVGEKAGHSIPAGFYNKKDSMSHFGDGTIRLGWYISVLATEWKLLNMNGQNLQATGEELYYALRAIERLDSVSGIMWSYYNFPNNKLPKDFEYNDSIYSYLQPAVFDSATFRWVPSVNYNPNSDNLKDGFFVRDDVPIHIRDYLEGVKKTASSHAESWSQNDHRAYYGNEMSQDQLVFLLMGLKFVDQLLPNSYTYNGVSLRQKSKDLCNRLMSYVVKEYSRAPIDGPKKAYRIVNPHLKNATYFHPNVKRGWNMTFYKYPFALIGNKVVYNKTFYGFGVSNNQVTGNTFMHNAFDGYQSFITSLNFFPNQYKTSIVFSADNIKGLQDNKTKEYALVACSDFFKTRGSPNSFHYLYKACAEKQFRKWPIYPLMNHVLFQPNEDYKNNVLAKFNALKLMVDTILSTYPCGGGYNYGTTDFILGWGQVNRWFIYNYNYNKPAINDAFIAFKGNGNGEDYMLLYNLYRLAYYDMGGFEPYINMNNPTWKVQYPYYDGSLGWQENLPDPGMHFNPGPLKFRSYVDYVSGNPNETGDVELKSATSIHLLPKNSVYPGFGVEFGAKFHAKILDGEKCDVHGYKILQVATPDPENPEIIDDSENEISQFLPFNKNNLHIYPNPAIQQIHVEIIDSTNSEFFNVKVIDILGKLHIEKISVTDTFFNLTVENFKPGMYLVMVKSSNGTVFNGRFIKQ